jgi:hypothetical protein
VQSGKLEAISHILISSEPASEIRFCVTPQAEEAAMDAERKSGKPIVDVPDFPI